MQITITDVSVEPRAILPPSTHPFTGGPFTTASAGQVAHRAGMLITSSSRSRSASIFLLPEPGILLLQLLQWLDVGRIHAAMYWRQLSIVWSLTPYFFDISATDVLSASRSVVTICPP